MQYEYIISGVLALGAIAYAFYFAWMQSEQTHSDSLQAFALDNGFSFVPKDDGNFYLGHLSNFRVLSEGRAHRVSNVLVGSIRGETLLIFEHSYLVMRHKVRQTCAIIHTETLKLPLFELRYDWSLPKQNDGIKFNSHPEFSSCYILRGENEALVRDLFHTNLLSFLEKHPGLGIEGCKNDLLIYQEDKRLEADDLLGFTSLCHDLYSLISWQR